MFWYVGLYTLGLYAAMLSPVGEMEKTMSLIAPITLTALIASLLVPFAGFTNKERMQKWAVQYGIVPLFGVYTALAWHYASVVGFLLLVGATVVHFGYWTSSIHSRNYRLKMFELAFSNRMPGVTQLVARLHVTGKADIADQIVTALIKSERVREEQLRSALGEAGDDDALTSILKEVTEAMS